MNFTSDSDSKIFATSALGHSESGALSHLVECQDVACRKRFITSHGIIRPQSLLQIL